MENSPNIDELEQFYEQQILTHYGLDAEKVQWKSHDKIGYDVFAHYFDYENTPYTLVFEDFPSEAHFIAEDSEEIATKAGEQTINLAPSAGEPFVENKTGYFTLYTDK